MPRRPPSEVKSPASEQPPLPGRREFLGVAAVAAATLVAGCDAEGAPVDPQIRTASAPRLQLDRSG